MNFERGYVATMSALIVGAVALSIAVTVSLLAIGEGQSSFSLSQGEKALQITEGCMEDALLKIRNSASYAGGSITRPEGACTITVSQAGTVYTVTATTTATNYRRTIQAVVSRSGSSMTISSWKEI